MGSSLQPHTNVHLPGASLPADSRAGASQLLLSVGVQRASVPACPERCVLLWAAPGGRAGWWDGLLSCVGCTVPAGAAVWHQAIQPPPVLRLRAGRESLTSWHGDTGCSGQTCSGREPGLVSSPLASGRLRGGCCRQVLLSLHLRIGVSLPVVAGQVGGTCRKQGRCPSMTLNSDRTHK